MKFLILFFQLFYLFDTCWICGYFGINCTSLYYKSLFLFNYFKFYFLFLKFTRSSSGKSTSNKTSSNNISNVSSNYEMGTNKNDVDFEWIPRNNLGLFFFNFKAKWREMPSKRSISLILKNFFSRFEIGTKDYTLS